MSVGPTITADGLKPASHSFKLKVCTHSVFYSKAELIET